MLSKEEVLKIAKLSRLKISDAEIESFAKPLDKLLHYMEDLKALDLSDVEPMTGVEDAPTVLREDVPLPSLSHEQAFANAPEEASALKETERMPRRKRKTAILSFRKSSADSREFYEA